MASIINLSSLNIRIKISELKKSQIITNDEEQSKKMNNIYSFCVITYSILSESEIPEVENETASFPLLA